MTCREPRSEHKTGSENGFGSPPARASEGAGAEQVVDCDGLKPRVEWMSTPNSRPKILTPKPETRNPKPETQTPKPETPTNKPQNPNNKPYTATPKGFGLGQHLLGVHCESLNPGPQTLSHSMY